MVCNYGLVNGLSRKDVLQVFSQYGQVESIIMLPHKSYCFICYTSIQEAISAWDNMNWKVNSLPDQQLFFLIYTVSGNVYYYSKDNMILCNYIKNFSITVPKLIETSTLSPSGLEIIDNFITEEEEDFMLQYLEKNWSESSKFFTLAVLKFVNNYSFSSICRFNEASSSKTLWI